MKFKVAFFCALRFTFFFNERFSSSEITSLWMQIVSHAIIIFHLVTKSIVQINAGWKSILNSFFCHLPIHFSLKWTVFLFKNNSSLNTNIWSCHTYLLFYPIQYTSNQVIGKSSIFVLRFSWMKINHEFLLLWFEIHFSLQ